MPRQFIKYRIILFVCVLANTFTSFSQQYNFKNFTTKNGLPGSSINAIFQDSKGFIWFGAQGSGISRFDGKRFKNYTKNDGLVANDVTCINEDKEGNIWIGTTADGISKFDGKNFYNYTVNEGLANNSVYSIYIDNNNVIWFGTSGGGVSLYDGKNFKQIATKNGLSSDIVYAITQDRNGDYWFALGNGIAKYDGNHISNYDNVNFVNNNTFFSLLCDSKGNVWFGSINGIVIKYSEKKFETLTIPEEVNKDFIGSIAEDKQGNIWFATDHGALKFDGEKCALFNEKCGLSSNGVLSIIADYEGNMWFGTQSGGVNLFSNESFATYTSKDGLISNKISSLLQMNDKEYLVGTISDGISALEDNIFSHLSSIPKLSQSNIISLNKDNLNNLWVGTEYSGLFILKKEGKQYQLKKKIITINKTKVNTATKIIQNKSDIIWIATFGSGVFKIEGNDTIQYSKANGLATDNILTMYQDSKNVIWLGTLDAGLIKFENNKFINYTENNGLANKAVWTITEDDQHNIYLGTGEGGLSCFDGKEFKTISMADGLCSNYIPALLWDKIDKQLWLGTDKGINKLKLDSGFKIQSLRYYGEQEGFKGVEVNQNAILLDSDGLVWFGTTNGLSRYNRNYDFPNTTAPKLNLNGIRLNYQSIDWKKYTDSVDAKTNLPANLVLSYKNNNLTFDFQALTTDNVKYSFMLEGQDEDWSPLSTNSEASFTNISPGKTYTFKVKAINSNGVWSKDVIEYTFTINPPWWQTWWFYSLSIILVFVSVVGFIHYRTSKLAKEKKVLEEKVTERTIELKDANDKLSVAFQDIKDSINYAKKIQDAILPLDEEIKKEIPQSFVLFKPRDVVSGDFYWFNKKDRKIYIAAVDCTGHGVPGAFMSMIGNSLLNEIISKKGTHDAGTILKKLHKGVIKALKQDRESFESKDGMDLALAIIDIENNILEYAGAKRPLYFFTKKENEIAFEEIKADKQSIGGLQIEDDYSFSNHTLELKKGDTFYLFTDGYVDQFGGEKGKKFSTGRFKDILSGIQSKSMQQQHETLSATIDQWKSTLEQIDDILVIGVRI